MIHRALTVKIKCDSIAEKYFVKRGIRMRRMLFTSESVTEGHPDKVADRISDSILDAIIDKDPLGVQTYDRGQ